MNGYVGQKMEMEREMEKDMKAKRPQQTGQACANSRAGFGTLADEAADRMARQREEHRKRCAAYEFLILHPEFDEFLRLVRSGSIQV